MEAASCWLVGPGHKAASCRTPGGPKASAGSLMGRVRVHKTPGLLPTHWWVKPGPGVSAGLLAGRIRFWGLVTGPRSPRADIRSLVGGWGQFLKHRWVLGLGCSGVCVGLLLGRVRAQLVPGQGLACCRLVRSTGYGIVVFLNLFFAPWWVRLIQRLGQASWRAAPGPRGF